LNSVSGNYLIVLFFLLGSVFGSFLECLADRGEKRISIITKERSFCPACGHKLGVLDLIPILSWIALKGKCRYCGAKIPPRHLVLEAGTACIFTALFLRFGISLPLLRGLILMCCFIPAAIRDFDTGEIPDGFFITASLLWLPTLFIDPDWKNSLVSGVLGAVVVPGVLLALAVLMEKILKRDALGGADIKLLFASGLYLGLGKSILSLFLMSIYGLILAAVLKKKSKEAFPLGPAILLAVFTALMAGDPLIRRYISLFYR